MAVDLNEYIHWFLLFSAQKKSTLEEAQRNKMFSFLLQNINRINDLPKDEFLKIGRS